MPRVIQQPSAGQQLQQGLSQLLIQLQTQKLNQFRQQQQAQQEQQLKLQQISQRTLEKDRAGRRVMDLMRTLGPGVLEDESVQEMMEESGLNPQTISKRFKEEQKKAADQLAETQKAALLTLPEEIRPGVQAFFSLTGSGLGQEAATAAMQEIFKSTAIDPDRLAELTAKYPTLLGPDSGIPQDQALEEIARIEIGRFQLGQQFGPDYNRHLEAEIKQKRLQILRAQLPAILNAAEGKVTPNMRLRSALALRSIVMQDLAVNQIAYIVQHTGWLEWSTERQVREVFGPEIASAWAKIPGVLALHGLENFLTTPVNE